MPASDAPPRLSVLVNNYNYRRFLGEALDSALGQMRDGDELIVVDDGSGDDSLALLREFEARHGITVIAQSNQGQLKSVRVAIEAAGGDVVVLLDSDDYFLPGYLDRLRRIYRDHPEVDCVFAGAEVGGSAAGGIRTTRRAMERMALPAGVITSTRWATGLFFEFVGSPTSGNSMRRPLANRIMTLPREMEGFSPIHPLLARLLRIRPAEAARAGLSADGVLVRASSMLGAVKYYDDRPGFFYRIHGGNKYAGTSASGRWYLRRRRKQFMVSTIQRHFDLPRRPPASELRAEILQRPFGRRLRRRLHIRSLYCLAALRARGSLRERLAALTAAAGITLPGTGPPAVPAAPESTAHRRTAAPGGGIAERD